MQRACYFGCKVAGPLYSFPSPKYPNEDRFNKWKSVLGEDVLHFDDYYIHRNVHLCGRHFEPRYQARGNRLTGNSFPTLNLSFGEAQQAESSGHVSNVSVRDPSDLPVTPVQEPSDLHISSVQPTTSNIIMPHGSHIPTGRKRKGTHTVLHGFPNPDKDQERFNTWLYAIGGDIMSVDNLQIYKYRRVCRRHFEDKYLCRSNRVSCNAVPTLNVSISSIIQQPLCEQKTQQKNLSTHDLSTLRESSPTPQPFCEKDIQQKDSSSSSEINIKKESSLIQQPFCEEDTQQADSASSETPVQKDDFYISRDPVIMEIIKAYKGKEKECKKLKTQLRIMRKRELRYTSRISALEKALKLALSKEKVFKSCS